MVVVLVPAYPAAAGQASYYSWLKQKYNFNINGVVDVVFDVDSVLIRWKKLLCGDYGSRYYG